MSNETDLSLYIKASYPLLWMRTSEESRAELVVLRAVQDCKRNLRIWSCTKGLWTPDPQNEQLEDVKEPMDALVRIQAAPYKTVFIFRDFHPFLTSPHIVRMVRDITHEFKQKQKTLIIVSPVCQIPPEIEREIVLIDFKLPVATEMEHCWDTLVKNPGTAKIISNIGKISEEEKDKIIQSSLGMTITEAEGAFAKAIVQWGQTGGKENNINSIVLKEKASTVKKSGILEYFEASETVNDIGGLENLKKWLEMRSNVFSKKARDFGLPMPKGILIAGLPGTGKSLFAKASSNILGVPLIRFDVGRVFGSLVGQSEENLRKAIQIVESIGSCSLWLDELDKAFSGMMSNFNGDSGVSQRVFGNFITWMQEKTAPIFIVATVNRIGGLPPEMLRKGRFDEIFFVGLPSPKEREEILKIHVTKFGRDANKFDFKKCIDCSEGFSGAELEFAVITGLYSAFHQNARELTDSDILKAIKETNPLSVSKADVLREMVEWAKNNAVNASSIKSESKNGIVFSAGRDLEL